MAPRIPPEVVPHHFPPSLDPAIVEATNDALLGSARRALKDNALGKGGVCPCCGGFARFYERRINATMAKCLVWLVGESGTSRAWVNLPKQAPRWLLRSNQLATLRHWELVEKRENENPKIKSSGIWRPTPIGRAWVVGKVRIPTHAVIYKGDTIGNFGDAHTVQEALGSDTFDYERLMAGPMFWELQAD